MKSRFLLFIILTTLLFPVSTNLSLSEIDSSTICRLPVLPAPIAPSSAPKRITRQILEYFKAQLDCDEIAPAPSKLYERELAPSAITREKESMWKLWRKANAERLQKSGMAEITSAPKEIVWNIPKGERMKAVVFSKGSKPEAGYPLFIHLHGGGRSDVSDPWGSTSNTASWKHVIGFSQEFDDSPSVYFIPRMADDRIGRWYLAPQRNAFRRAFQLGILSGNIDPKRVYLIGISEGGYGSHRLAVFMPDYFAGIGPMAAAEPLKAPENLRNTAFCLEVGERDYQFKRVDFARAWAVELQKLHRENPSDFINFVEIQPGRGHGIDYSRTSPWLARHKRRTYPERISYLYHNMTPDYPEESYAAGIYYLDFRKLRHTRDAMMRVDLKRRENRIDLTTLKMSGEKIWGEIGIYIDADHMDLKSPIEIYHNGRLVYNTAIIPNSGVIVESIALWGDPERIYAAKCEVSISL